LDEILEQKENILTLGGWGGGGGKNTFAKHPERGTNERKKLKCYLRNRIR
jgi:hypothetical protein